MGQTKIEILKNLAQKFTVPVLFLVTSVIQKLQFEPEDVHPREKLSGFRRRKMRQAEAEKAAKQAADRARQLAQAEAAAARLKYVKMTYQQIKEALIDMFRRGIISKSLLAFLLAALIDIYRNSQSEEEKEEIISLLLALGFWFLASVLLL